MKIYFRISNKTQQQYSNNQQGDVFEVEHVRSPSTNNSIYKNETSAHERMTNSEVDYGIKNFNKIFL